MNILLYRFCAKLIDLVVYTLLSTFLVMLSPFHNLIVINLIAISIYLIYFCLIPYKFNATFGQKCLGLIIKPKLKLWQYLFREPITYFMIGEIIISIVGIYNRVISIRIMELLILFLGVMLFLFYFKHDFWNKMFNCEVVEKKCVS